ncbi:XRE family transcriptional regulator [bacterium]|nr:MAG: XRE family transcriptional regulator [bacterium]
MTNNKKQNKLYSLEEVKQKFIGKRGTKARENYESELRLDLLGELIKNTREQRKLTQEQLGTLIGVNKSEISKLERNSRNMTLNTVIKVFDALKAKVKIEVEIDKKDLIVA